MNPNALEAKKATVAEIQESLAKSESLTVVSYQGLTVAELMELRRTLEKTDSTFKVYKNTMVRRALAEAKQPELGDLLEGPNAFVFSKDLSAAPKALFKFARVHDALVVKGALAEGQVFDAAKTKELSKLPGREGMLSMFLGCLKAPMSKFAATIKAVADKDAPAADARAAN